MTAFTDKVAVVTGASSGIGKAIAMGLAEQGAILCLVGRNKEGLMKVADGVRLPSARWFRYQVDLTVDENVQELTESLLQDFGYIDLLVHSAGVIFHGPVEQAPVAEFDCQYRTNVRAPYLLTQTLLPLLRPRRGQIVFINSSVGLSAKANVGQYSASKHALKAICDSLRQEVNGDGLRVLSVFLGRTATPVQAAVHKMENRMYRPELLLQPEDVATMVINALSLPRTAEVTDISIRPAIKTY